MHIRFVEVRNFRKLQSVRIDFSDETTLLVGANNSGKTSAMASLRLFLVDEARKDFSTNDFTLSRWPEINKIGVTWESLSAEGLAKFLKPSEWEDLLPSLDVWLEVGPQELHYVRDLLPTLDWMGVSIGVRLRFEPKDITSLQKEYLAARNAAKETKAAGAKSKGEYTLTLWPNDLRDFLDRRLRTNFCIRSFLLDPTKQMAPTHGIAHPQQLPVESESIETNPLDKLIKINEISAQRGMAPSTARETDDDLHTSRGGKLSRQLRAYYNSHLDPSENPEPADLDALQAIESAQKEFDGRLAFGFASALAELKELNYPGVTDPELTIATRIRATDGLSHAAAVQYTVVTDEGRVITAPLRLPEEYNGLGYQNLISMVFQLMAFRDAWMRVGKLGKVGLSVENNEHGPHPLHLVLIEEPEAHLHCQVQQVFIKKAYDVLRKHEHLGDKGNFKTQLVVSTHSSHVAHEIEFSSLRYFRRLPAAKAGEVPFTSVINLSEVFGTLDDTKRFVIRYLRATHADLFFADAAILIEGPAERLLVPHFIRKHFKSLDRCYVSLLEIGGSHAHRLQPLIEHLGLTTLIITDLDSAEAAGYHKATAPNRGQGQITRNTTLKTWHPKITSIDDLLSLPEINKVLEYKNHSFRIRVAYQLPTSIEVGGGVPIEVLATTLEDSLVFANLPLFKGIDLDGPVNQIREAVDRHPQLGDLGQALFTLLKDFDKAAFALDLLFLKDPETLNVPQYIHEGLTWLEGQLTQKKAEVLATAVQPQP